MDDLFVCETVPDGFDDGNDDETMPGLLDIEHGGLLGTPLAPRFPSDGDNDSDDECPGLESGSESSESESEADGEADFMRHMICHETLTFSGKDDEVEKEEAFPLGKSDVCRAKLEVYTATGALVKVTIAPDTVSSVVMASRPLLHGLHRVNLNKPEPQIKKNSTGRVTLFLALFVGPMCLLEHEGSGKIEKVLKKLTPACIARILKNRALKGVRVL